MPPFPSLVLALCLSSYFPCRSVLSLSLSLSLFCFCLSLYFSCVPCSFSVPLYFLIVLLLGTFQPTGKEGPFVHIAASLVSVLTRRIAAFRHLRESTPLLQQLYSSAAAVGVASAVRAPIGGLLFSVEVTSVSYEVSSYWKGFWAVASGTALVYFIDQDQFFFLPSDLQINRFAKREMVAFFFLGIGGGLVGALFVVTQRMIYRFRHWHRIRWMFIERPMFLDLTGIFVAVLTAAVAFTSGEFLRLPLAESLQDLVRNSTLSATGADLHADDWGADRSVVLNLFIYGLVVLVLSAMATVLVLPAGLFLPALAIGAGWGRLLGEAMAIWFPALSVTPAGYAVIGAAAVGAGVTRTVSTVVRWKECKVANQSLI